MKLEDVRIVNQTENLNKVIEEVLRIGTERSKWKESGHVRLGSGAYGCVYNVMGYAVKVYFDFDDENVEHDDGVILDKLHGCELFPKLYAYIPHEFMIVEKIEGKEFCRIVDGDPMDSEYRSVIKQAHKLVKDAGLVFSDVHSSNVMLTTEGKVKIVDVGRMYKHDAEKELEEVLEFVDSYYETATETERIKRDTQVAQAQLQTMQQLAHAI